MVVLTFVTQNNGETVFFDEPLSKVHFIKLVSCSLYNSWHTLNNEGTLSIVEPDKSAKVSKIPPGHYTLETLAKTMEEAFKIYIFELSADTYSPLGQLVITNHQLKQLRIDRDIANLLGIGRELKMPIAFVKHVTWPTSYFIHCNLINKNKCFLNNKRSDLLATFDIKGRPYEKVSYDASPQQPFRDCSTDSHANSIALSVKDQYGELFDFNGLPLKFELEIN